MANDPNWLLSTTAQSAAALVAIIGGFLVSRVISLAGQREGLEHRLDVIDGELESADTDIERLNTAIVRVDALDFVDDSIDKMVESPKISLEELMRLSDPRGLTAEQLAPFIDRERAVMTTAAQKLVPLIGAAPTLPMSLDSLREQTPDLRIAADEERTWDLVFRRIKRAVREKQKKAEAEKEAARAASQPFYLPSVARFDVEDFADLPFQGPTRDVTRGELLKELETTRASAQRLDVERGRISQETDRLRQPREVWVGIGALVYFAVVGIVWPIFVMADLELARSSAWRGWLVGAFVSGLLALLGFLFYAIRRLGRPREPDAEIQQKSSS